MMRNIVVIGITCMMLLFVSCDKPEETQMQETVVEAVMALSAGDVERYLQYADFGEEPDSLHVTLLRMMLARHKTVIDQKGGVSDIVPQPCVPENDSLAYMSYTVRYLNGTKEQKIAKLVRKGGRWKMCVK